MRAKARELIARYRVKTPLAGHPIAQPLGRQRAARRAGARAGRRRRSADRRQSRASASISRRSPRSASQIMEQRNRGAAVLLVCEDLDEILELADRIVVMSGGRIVYEERASEVDLLEVGRRMAGH